jgi:hypothetical protein
MTPTDGYEAAAAARRAELERAATRYRQARQFRRGRPSPVLRLYARIWWATRPRVDAWGLPPTRTAHSQT